MNSLRKCFRVHRKSPGLWGSVKSLVTRQWEEKWALNNINLNVNAGEILGLVGANGAGKTTLVKILAGIIHPTSGKVSVNGFNPWEGKKAFRRDIALIMGQKAQLWWDLPAADCFLLLKEIYQITDRDFQRNLDFLVQTLDVSHQLNIQVRRLSLGERMKMELIAALLHRPKVVFLDEPTIGLDLTAQKAIRKFLLNYQQEHRSVMILTSHYMDDIEQLCERIVIMRLGEIIYDGKLREATALYGDHRILALTPVESRSNLPIFKNLNYAEFVNQEGEVWRFRANREAVAKAAGELLALIPTADLSIEEEDIGHIIEILMRKGLEKK